jgi:hypothetical protein
MSSRVYGNENGASVQEREQKDYGLEAVPVV